VNGRFTLKTSGKNPLCFVSHDEIEVEITHAQHGGAKIGADKGINLPDSELQLPALTVLDEKLYRLSPGTRIWLDIHSCTANKLYLNYKSGWLDLAE
jgi:hypothetical protein